MQAMQGDILLEGITVIERTKTAVDIRDITAGLKGPAVITAEICPLSVELAFAHLGVAQTRIHGTTYSTPTESSLP